MKYYVLGTNSNVTNIMFVESWNHTPEEVVKILNTEVEYEINFWHGKETRKNPLCYKVVEMSPCPPSSVMYLGTATIDDLDTSKLIKVEAEGLTIYHTAGDCC